jgi:molecular chaperone GrpE
MKRKHENEKNESVKPDTVIPPEPATAPAPEPATEAQPAASASEPASTTQPTPEETVSRPAFDDRLLRLQADFDNYRKRVQRERQEIVQRANEELIADLLPTLDHLDLAITAATTHGANQVLIQGFQIVSDQFRAALKRFGLEHVDAHGQPFDPRLHEAISFVPSADVPESTVIQQTRRGYKLGTKLLRPAQVMVSSGAPPAPTEPPAQSPPSPSPEPTTGNP